ncbi:MAG: hypothetical protein RL596_1988 [Bacteroidota bacterium]
MALNFPYFVLRSLKYEMVPQIMREDTYAPSLVIVVNQMKEVGDSKSPSPAREVVEVCEPLEFKAAFISVTTCS